MNNHSQNRAISEHLHKGHGISSLLAFKMFGCTRLSARVYELKREGLPISDSWAEHGGKRFKIYRIK